MTQRIYVKLRRTKKQEQAKNEEVLISQHGDNGMNVKKELNEKEQINEQLEGCGELQNETI